MSDRLTEIRERYAALDEQTYCIVCGADVAVDKEGLCVTCGAPIESAAVAQLAKDLPWLLGEISRLRAGSKERDGQAVFFAGGQQICAYCRGRLGGGVLATGHDGACPTVTHPAEQASAVDDGKEDA